MLVSGRLRIRTQIPCHWLQHSLLVVFLVKTVNILINIPFVLFYFVNTCRIIFESLFIQSIIFWRNTKKIMFLTMVIMVKIAVNVAKNYLFYNQNNKLHFPKCINILDYLFGYTYNALKYLCSQSCQLITLRWNAEIGIILDSVNTLVIALGSVPWDSDSLDSGGKAEE